MKIGSPTRPITYFADKHGLVVVFLWREMSNYAAILLFGKI